MIRHLNKSQQEELAALTRQSANRILPAESVVNKAREKSSSLHSLFEWDDGKAAEQYRLEQARHVIRLYFVVIEPAPTVQSKHLKFKPATMRGLVSLKTDRRSSGGGYRQLTDVLKDPSMRAQLVEEALEELRLWRSRYKSLNELSEIFASIARAEGQFSNVRVKAV